MQKFWFLSWPIESNRKKEQRKHIEIFVKSGPCQWCQWYISKSCLWCLLFAVALTKRAKKWKRIIEIESIVKSGASLKCGQVSWLMQVLRDLKSSLSKENICCWRPTSRKENTCTAWLWSNWLCLDGRNRSGKWKPELGRVCKCEKNKMWKDKHSECA